MRSAKKGGKRKGGGSSGSVTSEGSGHRKSHNIPLTKFGGRDLDPDRSLKVRLKSFPTHFCSLQSTLCCPLPLLLSQPSLSNVSTLPCPQEQAVEAILVRWQYAGIQWDPTHGAGGADVAPPAGFMPLGLEGVFVGIKEDLLGRIHDERARSPRPSASYLITLPCATLKSMWHTALTRQRDALAAVEHEDAPLLKALRDELRTVEKFNAGVADANWAKEKAESHFYRSGAAPAPKAGGGGGGGAKGGPSAAASSVG